MKNKERVYTLEELKELVANSNQLKMSELVQLIQCDTKRKFTKLLKSFIKE